MTELADKPQLTIPTSQVAFVHLHCYHAEAVQKNGQTVHILVDPAPEASAAVQAWAADGWADTCEEDGGVRGVRGIRHLVIHDRHGERRFICVRPGKSSRHSKDCIVFESVADYDSVLPNAGVDVGLSWSVKVDGVGIVGTVHGETEELARFAAIRKFAKPGRRPLTGALPLPDIYENDAFSVRKK